MLEKQREMMKRAQNMKPETLEKMASGGIPSLPTGKGKGKGGFRI